MLVPCQVIINTLGSCRMRWIARTLLVVLITCSPIARAQCNAQTGHAAETAQVAAEKMTDNAASEGDLLPSVLGTSCRNMDADACDCWPQWNLQAESIFLWRDNDARNRSIGLLNPQNIDFDAGIGPMITLGLRADASHGWEGRYFSALEMNGGIDSSSSNFQFAHLDLTAPGFNGPVFYALQYQSDLHSAELNYVHTWDRFSVLGGFRFVRLSENFEWRTGRAGISSEVISGSLGMHTDNDLYGGQVGARWRQNYQRLFCDLTGRAGVFANEANQSVNFRGFGYLDPSEIDGSTTYDNAVAFVGDLNLSAGCRLTSVWAIRAGYNLMWIDRVALAPDQFHGFGFENQQVAIDGSVFLHGANVGFEGQW